MSETYQQYQDAVKTEQADMNYEEIKDLMSKQSDFMLELDNVIPQKHIWINRGAKLTCENAGHPMHEAWLRRNPR